MVRDVNPKLGRRGTVKQGTPRRNLNSEEVSLSLGMTLGAGRSGCGGGVVVVVVVVVVVIVSVGKKTHKVLFQWYLTCFFEHTHTQRKT